MQLRYPDMCAITNSLTHWMTGGEPTLKRVFSSVLKYLAIPDTGVERLLGA